MSSDPRRIVAIGGGGFVTTPDSPLIPYVVGLARRSERPRVCFVGTASGDSPFGVTAFYRVCSRLGYEGTDLPLFNRDAGDVRAKLLGQDAIWVGGGNTANLLAVWRLHGVDVVMREAWEAGIVLAGSSAGMICWFEASITDSFGPQLSALRDGLGLLPGSACPHYDSEARRRPVYREAVAAGFPGGHAADNDVALRFDGVELAECVSAREGASAWRVDGDGERALPTRFLPSPAGP